MVHSHSNLCLLCLALAPLGAHAAAATDTRPPPDSAAALTQPLSKEKIHVDCAEGKVDYKTHVMVCRNIVISQGNTQVRADHARGTGGLNFENSRWTFAGNVQIDAPPRGSLRSDQATVEFRDNRIAGATITGSPAEFQQQRADDLGMEKGHADQIVYDVDQGTVLLTRDAWISDGHNEMSAPSIAYSIREQKVLASSAGASQGVHITITPQAAPKRAPPNSAPPKPAPPNSAAPNSAAPNSAAPKPAPPKPAPPNEGAPGSAQDETAAGAAHSSSAPPPPAQTPSAGAGAKTSVPPPPGHYSALPGPRPRFRGDRYALDAYLYDKAAGSSFGLRQAARRPSPRDGGEQLLPAIHS